MTNELAVIVGLISAVITYVISRQIQKKYEISLKEEINSVSIKCKNAEEQLAKNILSHAEEISQIRMEFSQKAEEANKVWQDKYDTKCIELNLEKSDNAKKQEETSTYWQDKLENKIRELNAIKDEDIKSSYERGRADELRANDERAKAFSVEARPYIKVEDVTEYMGLKKRKSVHIGYQYQLFVTTTGIPAGFPPCIITHENYIHEEIDKELLREYKDIALKAAKVAVDLYTGGMTSLINFVDEPKIEGNVEVKESKQKKVEK